MLKKYQEFIEIYHDQSFEVFHEMAMCSSNPLHIPKSGHNFVETCVI